MPPQPSGWTAKKLESEDRTEDLPISKQRLSEFRKLAEIPIEERARLERIATSVANESTSQNQSEIEEIKKTRLHMAGFGKARAIPRKLREEK